MADAAAAADAAGGGRGRGAPGNRAWALAVAIPDGNGRRARWLRKQRLIALAAVMPDPKSASWAEQIAAAAAAAAAAPAAPAVSRSGSAAAPSPLWRLPDAAWVLILSWLDDPRDVARAARSCRRLLRCTRDNSLWRTLALRRWPEKVRMFDLDLDLRQFNWKTLYSKLHRREAAAVRRSARELRSRTPEAAAAAAASPPSPTPARAAPSPKPLRATCGRCSFLRGIASRPPVACLCPALPAAPLDNSRCPIVVLQDPRTQVNIGTVQLLSLGFSHCSVLQGQEFPEGQYPELDAVLERGHPLLLFPTPHALSPRAIRERLGELSLHDGDNEPRAPATTLIAIDGSWRYAKSLYKANPRVVSRCTRVAVKPTAPSIFGEIKREPSTTAVSTMEAVAMALGELLHDDSAYYLKDLMPSLRRLVDIQIQFRDRRASPAPA